MAVSKLPSQIKKKSPLEKYRERKAAKAAGRRVVTETPAEYRARVEAERAAVPTPTVTRVPTTAYGTAGLLEKVMEQPTAAEKLKQTYAPKGVLEQVISKQQAQKQALITGAGTLPTPQTRDVENIRAIIGTGYVTPGLIFGTRVESAKIQALTRALQEDLALRDQRINQRESTINTLEGQLIRKETALNSYKPLIKNGEFTGTKKQYNDYQKRYADYEATYNKYSRAAKLQNTDVNTFNKNVKSVESKRGLKTVRKAASKISAKYQAANVKLSKKLPTVKQAEPYIRDIVKMSPGYVGTKSIDKVLKSNTTESLMQFYLGGYEAVQTKPLKAAATFATFFVGGIAVKGLGTAAKVLGAGAKTAKAARIIETGIGAVYVAQSGRRYMLVEDAKQAGFVTGDIIFNELLPAGLGLKYGIKVVKNIPKDAKLLKGTGTKRFLASERAALGKDTTLAKKRKLRQQSILKTENKVKEMRKTEDQLIREFEQSQQQWMATEQRLQQDTQNILKQIDVLDKKLASGLRTYSRSRARFRQASVTATRSAQMTAEQRSIQVQREKLRTQKLKLESELKKLEAKNKEQIQLQKQILSQKQKVAQNVALIQKTTALYSPIQLAGLTLSQYNKYIQKLENQAKQLEKQKTKFKQLVSQYNKTITTYKPLQKSILKQVTKVVPKVAKVPSKKPPRGPTPKEKLEEIPPIIPKIKGLSLELEKKRKPAKKKIVTKQYTNYQIIRQMNGINELFG